ncbi:DUF3426 domain-containing protein [Pseudoteredinibacter isoporae]|uniref:DUF3426 domain-containing protein n=1 Tax=Pseudoteredinibacter isoporae TaxID=570281 RepID=UPI0033401EE5
MITRCPACSTAFNVNSQQLASARGAVRCGSCLQVFKATDHIVLDGLQTSSPQPDSTTDTLGQSEQDSADVFEIDTHSLPEKPREEPREEPREVPTYNRDALDGLPSWDQYPNDHTDRKDPDSIQDFQELASDLDEDPFQQVDQQLAEQLDQELEAAFASNLDIEPPSEAPSDDYISSFDIADTGATLSELEPEPPLAPINDEAPTAPPSSAELDNHSDFFDELSELAEQSLEEATGTPAEASSDTDEQAESDAEQAAAEDIPAEPPAYNEPAQTRAPNSSEEPRFIDDDTEPFNQKPETNRSLPQAFSPELPEENDSEQDESWALDMMMKELDNASDLNQPSKIEQVLDGRTMEDSSPLEEILNDRPAPDLDNDPHPQEVELSGLDLSSELEDALSMESIESGHLSLAADSEFNLEQNNTDTDSAMASAEGSFSGATEEDDTQETSADTEDTEPELDAHIIPQQEEPSKAEMIDSIEPEPLEMEFRQEKPNWNWLWGTGAALALLLAVGQLAWIKFDDLNRQPPYRGYYQIACNILSCSLPPQIDLSKLKASNLVVRSHPETEHALVVDMVLLNLAQFEQEFPDIQLTFSDIQGKALASRVFRPSEYLAGELAGASRMPIQRPIHLSLDIVDPGNEAVNYKVDVR